MKDNPIAQWEIYLYVRCPHCLATVDLTTQPDFWADSDITPMSIITNKEVICPRCNEVFICDFDY